MCHKLVESMIYNTIMAGGEVLYAEAMNDNYGNNFSIHKQGVFGELLRIKWVIDNNDQSLTLSMRQQGFAIKTYDGVDCDNVGIIKIKLYEGDKFYAFLAEVKKKIAEIKK